MASKLEKTGACKLWTIQFKCSTPSSPLKLHLCMVQSQIQRLAFQQLFLGCLARDLTFVLGDLRLWSARPRCFGFGSEMSPTARQQRFQEFFIILIAHCTGGLFFAIWEKKCNCES